MAETKKMFYGFKCSLCEQPLKDGMAVVEGLSGYQHVSCDQPYGEQTTNTFIPTTTPCPRCKARGLIITNIKTDHNEEDIRTRYLLSCSECGALCSAVAYTSPSNIQEY